MTDTHYKIFKWPRINFVGRFDKHLTNKGTVR